MFGPPDDMQRYANAYAALFQHYQEIKTCEFYNEPWLFGYGFAGSAADYQRFQKMFCEAVLKVRPDMRIVAGNSDSFVIDNIEQTPSCWKGLLSGISDHPYTKDDSAASWRGGGNVRAYDAIGEEVPGRWAFLRLSDRSRNGLSSQEFAGAGRRRRCHCRYSCGGETQGS